MNKFGIHFDLLLYEEMEVAVSTFKPFEHISKSEYWIKSANKKSASKGYFFCFISLLCLLLCRILIIEYLLSWNKDYRQNRLA